MDWADLVRHTEQTIGRPKQRQADDEVFEAAAAVCRFDLAVAVPSPPPGRR